MSSIFRRLFCGPLGADACHELDLAYSRIRARRGTAIAWLWYFGHLFVPGTWALAVQLRRTGRGQAGHPRRPGLSPLRRQGGGRPRFSLGISLLDLKLGVRMLFKYPGITLVGTFAMSVAIAIVAGFHAFARGVLDSELPFPEGDRVVAIWNVDVSGGGRRQQTLGDMVTWRESLESLEDVGAFTTRTQIVFTADGQTLSVAAAQITPSAFRMLRVPPHLGRPLLADDERPSGPAVALLGFDLWQLGFEADTAIVGKTIRLGGVQHTVVGVMPSEFRFPINQELWTPIRVPGSDVGPGGWVESEFLHRASRSGSHARASRG